MSLNASTITVAVVVNSRGSYMRLAALPMVAINILALLLGAYLLYREGLPDSRLPAFILLAALVLAVLNVGAWLLALIIGKDARRADTRASSAAVDAISEAREQDRLTELRLATWNALIAAIGSRELSRAEDLLRFCAQISLEEYHRILDQITEPVARETFRLAGEVFREDLEANEREDCLIRLEGFITFILLPDTPDEEVGIESTGLEEIISLTSFEPEPSAHAFQAEMHHEVMAEVLPEPVPVQIDYHDIVNAALRIFTLEQISELNLAHRQLLFGRIRAAMEATGGRIDAYELARIGEWFAAKRAS